MFPITPRCGPTAAAIALSILLPLAGGCGDSPGTGTDSTTQARNRPAPPEALQVEWYDNGHKKLEGEMKSGRLDGPYVAWYPSGQKSEEGTYRNGERTGRWSFWNEDGTLDTSRSGLYENGEMVAD